MASTSLSGKTCLVTGASGFIGSQLCRELSKQGVIVKALLHSPSDGAWALSYLCTLGKEQIPKQAMEDVEVIFHLAGRTHPLAEKRSQISLYHQTNVEGTRSLLRAAKDANVKKIVFFSSVKSMGENSDIRLDECSEPRPLTPYGKSKLEAEMLVLDGGYVAFPTVLRLTMVYGNSSKGSLPRMVSAISKNRFPPFPKIENKRSMIHINDVVRGAILAASTQVSAGKTYILSDGIDYSTRQLYEIICQSIGKKIPLWTVPVLSLHFIAKIGDLLRLIIGRQILFDSDDLQKLIGNSHYSSKKAESELGFLPRHTLFNVMPDIIRSTCLR